MAETKDDIEPAVPETQTDDVSFDSLPPVPVDSGDDTIFGELPAVEQEPDTIPAPAPNKTFQQYKELGGQAEAGLFNALPSVEQTQQLQQKQADSSAQSLDSLIQDYTKENVPAEREPISNAKSMGIRFKLGVEAIGVGAHRKWGQVLDTRANAMEEFLEKRPDYAGANLPNKIESLRVKSQALEAKATVFNRKVANTPLSPAAERFALSLSETEKRESNAWLGVPLGVWDWVSAAKSDPAGAVSYVYENAAYSSPIAVGGVLGSVVSGGSGTGAFLALSLGYSLEYSSVPVEHIQEDWDINIMTDEGMQEFLDNPEAISDARAFSDKRAAAIMGVDALTLLLMGRLGLTHQFYGTAPAWRAVQQGTLDMTGSGTGEGLAQYLSEGEVSGYRDIADEMFIGLAMSAPADVFIATRDAKKSKQAIEIDEEITEIQTENKLAFVSGLVNWLRSPKNTDPETANRILREGLAKYEDSFNSDGKAFSEIAAEVVEGLDKRLQEEKQTSLYDLLSKSQEEILELREAASNGESVSLSLYDTVMLLGSDVVDEVKKHIRIDGGKTIAEAEIDGDYDFEGWLDDAETYHRQRKGSEGNHEAIEESMEVIKKDLSEQLVASGLFSGSVADPTRAAEFASEEAEIVAEFYAERTAERADRISRATGLFVNPLELHEANKVAIRVNPSKDTAVNLNITEIDGEQAHAIELFGKPNKADLLQGFGKLFVSQLFYDAKRYGDAEGQLASDATTIAKWASKHHMPEIREAIANSLRAQGDINVPEQPKINTPQVQDEPVVQDTVEDAMQAVRDTRVGFDEAVAASRVMDDTFSALNEKYKGVEDAKSQLTPEESTFLAEYEKAQTDKDPARTAYQDAREKLRKMNPRALEAVDEEFSVAMKAKQAEEAQAETAPAPTPEVAAPTEPEAPAPNLPSVSELVVPKLREKYKYIDLIASEGVVLQDPDTYESATIANNDQLKEVLGDKKEFTKKAKTALAKLTDLEPDVASAMQAELDTYWKDIRTALKEANAERKQLQEDAENAPTEPVAEAPVEDTEQSMSEFVEEEPAEYPRTDIPMDKLRESVLAHSEKWVDSEEAKAIPGMVEALQEQIRRIRAGAPMLAIRYNNEKSDATAKEFPRFFGYHIYDTYLNYGAGQFRGGASVLDMVAVSEPDGTVDLETDEDALQDAKDWIGAQGAYMLDAYYGGDSDNATKGEGEDTFNAFEDIDLSLNYQDQIIYEGFQALGSLYKDNIGDYPDSDRTEATDYALREYMRSKDISALKLIGLGYEELELVIAPEAFTDDMVVQRTSLSDAINKSIQGEKLETAVEAVSDSYPLTKERSHILNESKKWVDSEEALAIPGMNDALKEQIRRIEAGEPMIAIRYNNDFGEGLAGYSSVFFGYDLMLTWEKYGVEHFRQEATVMDMIMVAEPASAIDLDDVEGGHKLAVPWLQTRLLEVERERASSMEESARAVAEDEGELDDFDGSLYDDPENYLEGHQLEEWYAVQSALKGDIPIYPAFRILGELQREYGYESDYNQEPADEILDAFMLDEQVEAVKLRGINGEDLELAIRSDIFSSEMIINKTPVSIAAFEPAPDVEIPKGLYKAEDIIAHLDKMSDSDLQKLLTQGRTGDELHDALARAMEDIFARGFETYLNTGEAPSPRLQSMFNRILMWLSKVYERLLARKGAVPISPEVKSVMDRLLAADEEIAFVATKHHIHSFFPSPSEASKSHLTPKMFEKVSRMWDEVRNDATAKQARKIQREMTKEQKDKYKELKQDFHKLLAQEPGYRLVYALTTGKYADGTEPQESVVRINKASLEKIGVKLNRLPKVSGKTVYTRGKDTHSVDIVAKEYGFESAQALIATLYELADEEGRSNLDARAEGAADAEMQKLYPESPEDEGLESFDEVDKVSDAMTLELIAMGVAQAAVRQQQLRAVAKQRIADTPISKIMNVKSWRREEENYLKQASIAWREGNQFEAVRLQHLRMLMREMSVEATKKRKGIQAKKDYIKKWQNRKATSDKIHSDFLDAMKVVANTIALAKQPSVNAVRNKLIEIAETQAWLESMERHRSVNLTLPKRLRQMLQNIDAFDGMKWGDFEERWALIKNLEAQGKEAKSVVVGDGTIDIETVKPLLIAEAMQSKEHALTKAVREERSGMFLARGREFLSDFASDIIRAEDYIMMLGAKNPTSAWHKNVFEPVSAASEQKEEIESKFLSALSEKLNAMPKALRKKLDSEVEWTDETRHFLDIYPVGEDGEPDTTKAPRKGRITYAQLLMMALNAGNASNLQKLIDGERSWGRDVSADDLMSVLNTHLTQDHWELVQSVWDFADELWPLISAITRREKGVAPDRIAASKVVMKYDGKTYKYRGGYFPVIYDKARSRIGSAASRRQRQAKDLGQRFEYGRRIIEDGMVIERVEWQAPLSLDFSHMANAMSSAVHYITHYHVYRAVNALVKAPEVETAIDHAIGAHGLENIHAWLDSVVSDSFNEPPLTGAEKVIAHLQKLLTYARLAGSYTTIVAQGLGLFPAVSIMRNDSINKKSSVSSVRVAARVAEGTRKSVIKKAAREWLNDHSTFLAQRGVNFMLESQILNQVQKRGQAKASDELLSVFIGLIGKAQKVVDFATWKAAYDLAHEINPDIDISDIQARAGYADSVVRRSQSSGRLADISRIMRRRDAMRIFTIFYTYFNQVASSMFVVAHNLKGETGRQKAEQWANYTFWTLFMPSIMYSLMFGEPPEEDENLFLWLLGHPIGELINGIPIARELFGFTGNISPLQQQFNAMIRAYHKNKKLMTDWENSKVDSEFVMTNIDAAAAFIYLPAKMIGDIHDLIFDADPDETYSF